MIGERKCYICGQESEYICDDCEQPICESCCAVPSYMEILECTICTECHECRITDRAEEYRREAEKEEKEKKQRDDANAKRRANYWKPENVEKRRLAKVARKKEKIEHDRKMMNEAAKVVGKMFKGMF